MKPLALLLLPLGAATVCAAPARAVFDLRDAGPAALGSAALEESAEPLFAPEKGGFRAGASHAVLFQTPGLSSEGGTVESPVPGGRAVAAWNLVRAPGARESTASLSWLEGAAAPVGLGVTVERLDFTAQGATALGGYALGGRAAARFRARGAVVEGLCAVDRLLRSAALDRAGLRSALTACVALDSGGARLRYAERWEAGGERSPRLCLDLPLGGALRARFGRGGSPGRVGAALAFRVGSLEVSWGRLDFAAGGSITSVGVAWGAGE